MRPTAIFLASLVAGGAVLVACSDPGVDDVRGATAVVEPVEVEVTPRVCREALEAADRLVATTEPARAANTRLAQLVLEAAQAGVEAGAAGDEAQLLELSAEVDGIAAELEQARTAEQAARQAYDDTAGRCRA